jgi:hypothetical protein
VKSVFWFSKKGKVFVAFLNKQKSSCGVVQMQGMKRREKKIDEREKGLVILWWMGIQVYSHEDEKVWKKKKKVLVFDWLHSVDKFTIM